MSALQNSQTRSAGSAILPWIVWSSPVLFYFYQFALRTSPSVLTDGIMADLNLHAGALGALVSWYYVGYTVIQIPVGLLIDRVGVRLPLFFAAFLCVIGCYLFSTTDSLLVMSFGRFMIGIGSAFGFLSCVKTASLWFSPQRLGLIIGLTMMIGTMGAVFGEEPLSILNETYHWRTIVQGLGVLGFALAAYALIAIKANKYSPFQSKIDNTGKHWLEPVIEALKEILTNKYTYIFGIYGCMMYVHLSGFADQWGVHFINHTYGEDKDLSARAVTMIYWGVAAGAPISALLADYLKSYRKVLLIGAVGAMTIFTAHLYLVHLPFSWLYPMYFGVGLFSGSQFLCFAAVCANNCHGKTGAAAGIHNMMCMTSGIVFQPLIGYLLDWNWDGTIVENVPIYAKSDYSVALVVVPVSLGIAAIACLFMKETYKTQEA
jgi:MFS family permease